MSASVYWRPVRSCGRSLNVGAPSAFRAAMEKVFGSEPWALGPSHVQQLRAMAAVYDADPNPYDEIIAVIEQVDGEIEVFMRY